MTVSLAIFWIIIVSLFGVLGAWYARRYNRPDALIALYVTLVVFSNIAVSKTIAFDFGFIQFFAPATVLIFSVTFLLTDIVNERFGKKETERMILIALFSQIALICFSYLVLKARGAPFFQNQSAFEALLSNAPRIVIASLISFFISENVDAYLFHWFRTLTGGKHLWMRNVFSYIPAMLLDSVLFITLAFYGVMPIIPLIIGLSAIKWFVGIVDIPFMYLSRAILNVESKT
ncbi:MAG: queuosine precursor transporter [Candidatus Magasanikbacteria bacterium]|nr:queuosine precursor transporter [Candidatus Magasanikbacteria bacterium]